MVLPLTVHEIGVPRAAQLGAASLALLASYLLVRRQRHHQYRTRDMSSTETSVSVVDVSRVFQASELSQVTSSYGEANAKPQGLFIQGRHGYTHLIIDEPPSHVNPIENDKYGNCIVMAHGLGTSATAYSDLAAHMTSLGYFVVRYDYFGHGYSKFNGPDMWLEYSPDMLVDQVEDVIDYCTNNYTSHSLKIAAFVGHSTGGILAIHASARWGRAISNSTVPVRSMPRMILLSPAIWADKPLIAQIADRIPRTLTSLIKNISPLKILITDAYLDATKLGFAMDPRTKKYVHEAKEEQQRLRNYRLLGKVKGGPHHPFIHSSVMGLNCHTLRSDLLPLHRDKLIDILQDNRDISTQHVLFVWGDLDLTVPYKKNIDTVQTWVQQYPKKFHLQVVERMGHELLYEDSHLMGKLIQTFLDQTK